MVRSGLVATALAAVLFAATTGGLVAGRSAGVVRVSGASIGSIELTLEEGDAEGAGGRVRLGQGAIRFGTNLTPDGTPSDSPDDVTVTVDGSDPSLGACYSWAGSVGVRSNRAYAVTVTAARANDRLRFLASSPADFVSCARGERVGPAMFAGAAPVGAWITGQSRTSGRWHRFWLGLEVRWSDPPDPALVRTTLTFAAATSP